MTAEDEDQSVRFSITISSDKDGFLRRTCKSCGLDFKTEIDEADLAWALCSQIERLGLDVGARPSEEEGADEEISCPYCGAASPSSENHTSETIEYLKRFAYREYALPMIEKMFRGLEDSIGSKNRGDFISVSVSFEHNPSPRPVRPIHGPEPGDMKIVELLCCGKRIKIGDRWTPGDNCIYCKEPITIA